MKTLNLLFLLILNVSAFGQESKNFQVSLKSEKGNEPFYFQRIGTSIAQDPPNFKGIPNDIINFKIKRLRLWQTDNMLYIFYGLTGSNKRMIIFDSNFDYDFSGEKIYLFDNDNTYSEAKEKSVVDTTSFSEIKFGKTTSIFVRPDVYNCCNEYDNKEDSLWSLILEFKNHSEGVFEINNAKYNIAFNNSPYFNAYLPSFYIKKYEQSYESQDGNERPYKLKDPIIIDSDVFKIDSISRVGDVAWVSYIAHPKKIFGTRQGLYAENIIANTINNQEFNLERLKGNYILIDFWTTACGPCIALMPRLRLLNEKYKSKGLILVSIASDNKKNYEKLLGMIKEKQMDWIQIYEDQKNDGRVYNNYSIDGFPTSLLIDPFGKIILRTYGGGPDFTELENLINQTLK